MKFLLQKFTRFKFLETFNSNIFTSIILNLESYNSTFDAIAEINKIKEENCREKIRASSFSVKIFSEKIISFISLSLANFDGRFVSRNNDVQQNIICRGYTRDEMR